MPPEKLVYPLNRVLFRYITLSVAAIVVLMTVGFVYYTFSIKQASNVPMKPTAQSATTPPLGETNQVVYVLDQDLVRFGKFALAILAMFVGVGAFFYGFDIKQAAKEVHDSADKMRQISYDVNKAKDEIEQIESKSQQLLKRAQEILATAEETTHKMAAEIETYLAQSKAGAREITLISNQLRITRALPPASKTGASTARLGFTVLELKQLYNIPAELDGDGQCIGLIELGGGFKDSDLQKYFSHLKLRKPTITSVTVDGSGNAPTGDASGPDAQVTLDVEVAGTVAPGAHIVVYFGQNTEAGFLSAINRAIADKINHPSILSISWGGPESTWAKIALTKMNKAFRLAAEQGITILAAAGDSGVTDGTKDGERRVDFPASSPWVLACGGTRLAASERGIASEVVWNDGPNSGATGGGVSDVFPLPDWQSRVNVPSRKDGTKGRGVPDVAANASPASGYQVFVGGMKIIVGGTAASTPFWAGLIALINQALGRNVGHINPLLYQKIGPAGVFRCITKGDNSADNVSGYSAAGPDWSPTVGWGSPDGEALLRALREEISTATRN